MALRLVRQTSDTPNITNKDDTIMTRYAYGGYNGIVKSFGNECNYVAESGIFTIIDGRIVLDGWEVDIDGAGWTINLSTISGTQYHSVYLEIEVITETVSIKSTYLSGSYPEIQKGDDLTEVPNGTARQLLYWVKVTNGAIVEVVRKAEIIPYLTQKVLDLESNVGTLKNDLQNGNIEVKIAQYSSADTSKGTIEERLTRLGFKEGVITFMGVECDSTSPGTNYGVVKRIGNYVFGEVNLTRELTTTLSNEYFGVTADKALISFAEDFRIKFGTSSITTGFGILESFVHAFKLTINGVNGYASILKVADKMGYSYKFKFQFWFEAEPLA